MSSSLILAVLAAACLGAAAVTIGSALMPTLPNLADLIADVERNSSGPALDARQQDAGPRRQSLLEGVGSLRLAQAIPGPTVPYDDLDLLGITPNRFVGMQVGVAFVALMLPIVLGLFISLLGLPVSLGVPLLFGLVLAVPAWFLPHWTVRQAATAARERFGRAVTSYIDLVVLERLSGAGVASSVVDAAQVAEAPLFGRIQETLLRRQLERQPPHVALRDLADTISLPELRELADTLTIASQDSPVAPVLKAKARSIRNIYLARDVERAGRASQRQTAATAILLMCFLAFIGAPVILRLLAGGG